MAQPQTYGGVYEGDNNNGNQYSTGSVAYPPQPVYGQVVDNQPLIKDQHNGHATSSSSVEVSLPHSPNKYRTKTHSLQII
jgi:hypothetical protein